jgi:hypothetical protein
VPVAVGIVLVAALGGTLAFKDKLFPGAGADSTRGGGGIPAGRTDGAKPGPPPGGMDTTLLRGENPDTPAASGGRTGNPPAGGGGKPPRDVATKPIGTIPTPTAKVTAELPPLDDILDSMAPNRVRAREAARSIYNRPEVLDSVRANAAMLVGQSYTMDGNFREAKQWLGLAVQLHGRELYRKLLADAEKNLQGPGQN